MSEYKIIHVHVYDPKSNVLGYKSDKSFCRVIECKNSKNCGLYKREQCVCLHIINSSCVYGKMYKEVGYTQRAMSYYTWLNKQKDKYKDVLNNLTSFTRKMIYIGDYVFLPYNHITLNDNVVFVKKASLFTNGMPFLLKTDFTIENILSICTFIPHALMGGTINSYQDEVVPLFIKHLSEVFPEKYKELCKVYSRAKSVVDSYNYVGRKVLLKTISKTDIPFVDIHNAKWIWDGKYLTSKDSKASFMLVKKFTEIRITPPEDAVVIISDNDQVDKNTVFID